MSKAPIRVAVTGAAGQIGYSLLFRIAAGEMLGADQPVILQLLEIPDDKAQKALKGVMMELDDCAFPLLHGMVPAADPMVAFKDAEVALLVGARPRGPGMERKDLLEANGKIFAPQGKALSEVARREVKVLVVGNPANTNALIAMSNAGDLDPGRFTAMTRLDHNRAVTQIAQKLGADVIEVRTMTIWGNHSTTQYPDLMHCEVDGEPAWDLVADPEWIDDEYIPKVAKRGAEIISARGASSAASAANAAIDHMRDWVYGTPEGDWVSMGVPSDGSYEVPEGLISSFPCVTRDGKWQIVQGLEIDEFSRGRIDASVGVLQGLSIFPTVGGLGSIDMLASLGFAAPPDGEGFDGSLISWGLGAKLGILRESFTLPGLTASVESVQLLRDFVAWESRTLLRRLDTTIAEQTPAIASIIANLDTTALLLEHVSRQVAYRPLSILQGWRPPQGEMREDPAPLARPARPDTSHNSEP